MQCKWLQICCLCAALQFQFIEGHPDWTHSNPDTNQSRKSIPKSDTDTIIFAYNEEQQAQKNLDITTSQSTRHICNVVTEHYDCQINNVHLKNGEFHDFGLEHNPQQKLTFRDSTLEYLPKSLIDAFPRVTLLNLNSLIITSIQQNAFERAANLQTMYLENNRLTRINPSAFRGANNLQTLVLSKNEITSIDYYTFDSPTNLQLLYLDQNQLDSLPAFTYTAYLKILNASHNNIASINDNHFRNQRHLKTLDLSFNRLKRLNLQQLVANLDLVNVSFNDLTDFIMPPHVTRLDARNNSLTEFVVGQQCTLVNLILARNKLDTTPELQTCLSMEYLDLSNNLLEVFGFRPWMANLQYLILAHNNLFEMHTNKIPPKPFSLKVLELSHNKLSYGPSLNVFKKLEWVGLNDNNLISLKSYVNRSHTHSLQYRMSNNEWSCSEIKKFESSTVDKNKNLCAAEMRNENGICCRTYLKPYNDRLNQILREADFHERANQKNCPKPVSTTSNQITDEVRNAIASANAENADKLREIENARILANNWQKALEEVKAKRNRLNSSKRNVANEIEKQRQFHRVTKEGLISNKEMLERIIKFVQEKDTFNRGLLSRRQQDTEDANRLLGEKQQEIERHNLKSAENAHGIEKGRESQEAGEGHAREES
ncbi:slit homolog 1 protein-like isoform X5 [Ochlerotatus camptorhynchus]|uniref:slit homolog 1 protein-like isoform X5 n=1 Tax=Ochlerotatus camptorhynchus TaxID=644619 RepID=UPI0031E06138